MLRQRYSRVMFQFLLTILIMSGGGESARGWEKPGCHRIGHTRRVQIPDCVSFEITTNACRGYCVSYSVPSGEETTAYNPKQIITSVGQCCNILEYEEDKRVRVMCMDGPRDISFKSAKSCGCFHCKKE